MVSLIDTHVHLFDQAFEKDREAVCSRARAAGVEQIIMIAESEDVWQTYVDGVIPDNGLYAALGVHPHEADRYGSKDQNQKLKAHFFQKIRHSGIVAVGETGLDYFKKYSRIDHQKQLFLLHLEVARESGLPVIIHCREAYDDLIHILSNSPGARSGTNKGVIHCFSGDEKQAAILHEMGFLLGIDGPVTYPRSDRLKDVVKHISLEGLLLETDCPYLAPQRFRGKRNEPAYLTYIAESVARIKDVTREDVCRVTRDNAIRLFNLQNFSSTPSAF